MEKVPNIQPAGYQVSLFEMEMPGAEARNVLLTLVNDRIDYHNREHFGLTVRGKGGIDHQRAITTLTEVKHELNTVLSHALQNGTRVKITANLSIDLTDESNRKKVV